MISKVLFSYKAVLLQPSVTSHFLLGEKRNSAAEWKMRENVDNCDWWGHPERSHRPPLNQTHFVLFCLFWCRFLEHLSKRDRNMCGDPSVRVRLYITAVAFMSPLAAEAPNRRHYPLHCCATPALKRLNVVPVRLAHYYDTQCPTQTHANTRPSSRTAYLSAQYSK